MITVLVADTPEAGAIIRDALSGRVKIELAATMFRARRLLNSGVNAVIVGMHFDDSRMLEFIRSEHKRLVDTPVICVRVLPSAFGTSGAARAASIALGATTYLDSFEIEAVVGHQKVREEFGRLLLKSILG